MRASALLGYVPIGNMGLVLLATRIRDVLTLPGGHAVKLVVESKWFTVPLQARTRLCLLPRRVQQLCQPVPLRAMRKSRLLLCMACAECCHAQSGWMQLHGQCTQLLMHALPCGS